MTTDDNNDASNHERTTPGSGVTIRATELSDAQAIADLRHQPLVVRYSLALPHRSRETVEAWLARCASRRNGSLDLCALVDGRVVGHGGIEVGAPRRAHGASLGINVHDAYSGRGVGTALMAALVGRADRALGLRRIELTVFADNARAIALYRRFGFAEEGRSRGYASRDGALMDVLHMARLADAPAFAAQAD